MCTGDDLTDRPAARIETRAMMTEPKKTGTAILLAVLLGGLGAHRFYLRQYWQGALYVAFCWVFFIPAIVALIEAPFMPDRVRRFNAKQGSSKL